jgi:O-antigen/teichoic acid export membrane protein
MFKNRSTIIYLFANYAGVFLNMFSGILLARNLNTDTRGLIAIISLSMATMIFITAGNSSNSAMLSGTSSGQSDSSTELRYIYKPLIVLSFLLFLFCSPFFFLVIYHKANLELGILFAIACIPFIFNALIYYAEGTMRRNGSVDHLSLNRFIGLAIPSIYVFILNFSGILQIQYLVFSQTLVTLALLYSNKRYLRKFEKDYVQKFNSLVLSSFRNSGFYVFEFLAGFSLLIVASTYLDLTSLAYLAIAMSFASLMDAFIPTLESKFYLYFANANFKDKMFKKKLSEKLVAIFCFDLLFLPVAFTIPIFFGEKYSASSSLAVVLVLSKIPIHITRYLSTILLSKNNNIIPFIAQVFFTTIFYFWAYLFSSTLDIYLLLKIYFCCQISTLCFTVFLFKIKFKL